MCNDTFEKIAIGDTSTITHNITEDDIDRFADLSGDHNPLHMSEVFASQSRFKKRVAHGMLSAAFISTLIGTQLPGTGALWQSMNIQFLSPAYIGDTINILATVKHKSDAQQIIVLDIIVTNQNQKKIISAEATVKLPQFTQPQLEKKIMSQQQSMGTAIISGASGGIGSAIAKKLAYNGYRVVINYKSSKNVAENIQREIEENGGEAVIYQADMTDIKQVESMIKSTNDPRHPFSLIVNNASSPIITKKFSDLEWNDISDHLAVQLKGAFNLCKCTLSIFEKEKKGNIINLLTIALNDTPPPDMYDYTIAKSALLAFSKSLALEYGPKGIRVNCVAPGMTETNLISDLPEKSKLLVEATAPLRRLATPCDIAEVVAFLASHAARYITGETINVCGGIRMS